jgi:hypothetical protein
LPKPPPAGSILVRLQRNAPSKDGEALPHDQVFQAARRNDLGVGPTMELISVCAVAMIHKRSKL